MLRTLTRLVMCLLVWLWVAILGTAEVIKLNLNGLQLRVDAQTGSLAYLFCPATGVILEAPANAAGMLDVAYPIDVFPPLRLASRYSKARVNQESNGATIRWEALAPSRDNFPLPTGNVSAQVTIRAAGDGRSVVLRCRIDNHSAAPIPQILFPDLWGLKPCAGLQETRLRLARGVVHPFTIPFRPAESAPPYWEDAGWREYPAGGYYSQNALRWLDYGSLRGGLSVFQKEWGTARLPDVLTYRTQRDPASLRLAWEHKSTIDPGSSWDSAEFWLTPHPGGWAKGIEVFREYVMNVNPPRRLPRHVRDGLGFQTIWMTQEPEGDPGRAYFRFKDLPAVARDARAHGLDELVPWFWCLYFRLPISMRKDLGTEQDLIDGLRQSRELGVNVAPFASVYIVHNPERYGVKRGQDNWTYHPELIIQFRPYYTRVGEGTFIEDDNKLWQQDVMAALTEWVNRGMYSISWDQFIYKLVPGQKPELISLIDKVRDLARAKDPEATFASESITSLELDSSVLDYTWNWLDYVDAAPILNVLRSPRLNCNIDDSSLVVKKGFAEGLYLNVMPSKIDGPNGTALISEIPALSAALKEVAARRKQFLPYFTYGTSIGDSVLSQATPAFVRGYQLGKSLLVIVLNDGNQPQQVTVQSELGLWLPETNSYLVKYYDSAGKLIATKQGEGPRWAESTRLLEPLELAFFEIKTE